MNLSFHMLPNNRDNPKNNLLHHVHEGRVLKTEPKTRLKNEEKQNGPHPGLPRNDLLNGTGSLADTIFQHVQHKDVLYAVCVL